VHGRMTRLRASVRAAKGQVVAPEGCEALSQVGAAVEGNLKALDAISSTVESQRKEMAVVEEAAKRFHDLMEGVKGGVGSERDLTNLESGLKRLKADLPGYLRRVENDVPKKHLDALEKAIDTQVSQIAELKDSMREQLRDRGVVEEEAKAFQAITGRLKSGGGFSSRSDDNARSARSRVRAKGAEQALDQILEQYDAILSHINSVL
jgi:archaellum component FlaC